MSNNASSTTTVGVSGLTLLGIAFVVLKLCHVIDWPWFWVISPFWIPVGIGIVVMLSFLIVWLVLKRR